MQAQAASFASQPQPRIAVISCAVLEDEVRHYARLAPQPPRIEMLEQGLHNEPDKLRVVLQQAIDRIELEDHLDAIVLGYGLCSRGTEGVKTARCRLVMPRAHDCITVLLGSKERYAKYVQQNPGTYWYSPGWNRCHIPPGQERYERLYEQYRQKFGDEDAKFLMESEQNWFSTYNRATYVDLQAGVTEQDLEKTRQCAQWLNWSFDHQRGDPSLLLDMLSGRWDDQRFIILEPGQVFEMTADERVVQLKVRPHTSTRTA